MKDDAIRAIRILARAREVAAEQAEDDSLWFDADYITEAYLQAALRRLAAAIEDGEVRLEAGETADVRSQQR